MGRSKDDADRNKGRWGGHRDRLAHMDLKVGEELAGRGVSPGGAVGCLAALEERAATDGADPGGPNQPRSEAE